MEEAVEHCPKVMTLVGPTLRLYNQLQFMRVKHRSHRLAAAILGKLHPLLM
jgi:hypothetical protein